MSNQHKYTLITASSEKKAGSIIQTVCSKSVYKEALANIRAHSDLFPMALIRHSIKLELIYGS